MTKTYSYLFDNMETEILDENLIRFHQPNIEVTVSRNWTFLDTWNYKISVLIIDDGKPYWFKTSFIEAWDEEDDPKEIDDQKNIIHLFKMALCNPKEIFSSLKAEPTCQTYIHDSLAPLS